ncbi:fatty acid desaturase [Thalassolituus sp.]|uniref:fatty acid desaturase n=1 Tax=Thalassolituus sp. TaxID=2030822 RepID=UPI0039C33719
MTLGLRPANFSTHNRQATRALFAPFNVNFHIEHHALVSVPYWQLPRLHRLLQQHKAVPNPPSYWQVMRLAASNK